MTTSSEEARKDRKKKIIASIEIIRDTVLDMRFPGRVITFRLAIEGRAENP